MVGLCRDRGIPLELYREHGGTGVRFSPRVRCVQEIRRRAIMASDDEDATKSYRWWCPFCEEPIDEDDPYTHTYEHQDKGPSASAVIEYFQKRPPCPECGELMDVENWPGTGEYGYPGGWCFDCNVYLDTYTLEELGVLDQ